MDVLCLIAAASQIKLRKASQRSEIHTCFPFDLRVADFENLESWKSRQRFDADQLIWFICENAAEFQHEKTLQRRNDLNHLCCDKTFLGKPASKSREPQDQKERGFGD